MSLIIRIIICGVLIFLIQQVNKPPLPKPGEKTTGRHGVVIGARYKEKGERFNANIILVPLLIIMILSLFTSE